MPGPRRRGPGGSCGATSIVSALIPSESRPGREDAMAPTASRSRPHRRPLDEQPVARRPAGPARPPDPAQDPKPAEGKPASTNIRGAEYPRIHDDLRVTFRIKAPDAQKVEFGFFDNKRYRRDEGRGRLLDRDHGPRGAGLPLLPDVHRRRAGERPREPDVLRHRQGHQRDRDPGEGRRLLPAEGRPARRGPRALVLLEDDPGLAAHLRLHPARLRRRPRDAVSRPLPPARRRRGRDAAGRTRGA